MKTVSDVLYLFCCSHINIKYHFIIGQLVDFYSPIYNITDINKHDLLRKCIVNSTDIENGILIIHLNLDSLKEIKP